MNLASTGQQNIVLNGNPKKSFWKSSWLSYTNFGLQKFRIDYEGSTTLRTSEESTFTFKIPRYGDLLVDSFLSFELPNIWSPIIPPIVQGSPNTANTGAWIPYEYKWIEYLGARMINKITIACANYTIQEYSGGYLLSAVQRDFPDDKKQLFYEMIGHTPELNDPANSGTRVNSYPNAYYTTNPAGAEPSIRGRILYIPLNAWFGLKTQQAFPLVALQYNELTITITLRPIQELFQIRDVYDAVNNYPYIAPNFNVEYMQYYRFLQTPPDNILGSGSYVDKRVLWNTDIHLICTYAFLSNEEQKVFAKNNQKYLFKQVREQIFYNVTGPNKIKLDSLGMVSSFMFYFQRSDVNLRNEWSNYTNWPYNYLPYDIFQAPTYGTYAIVRTNPDGSTSTVSIGPGVNVNGLLTGWYITGDYNIENQKDILVNLGILLDGDYRENQQPVGVYNYLEKYTKTQGFAQNGLYIYNYCLNTSLTDLQPSGAINMSRFNNIELEFNTIIPPVNPLAQTMTICDPNTGNIVGINKPTWIIYQYNFNMIYYEERINFVEFLGGNVGLTYAT